jgi:hypothetical protein
MHLELCCEHPKAPHRVERQQGMSLTTLSDPLREHLDAALPYINGALWILTTIAKVALNNSSVPDVRVPDFKVGQEHPMLAGAGTSTIQPENALSHVFAHTPEHYREWQKCFKDIMIEKHGADVDIKQTIAKNFRLYPLQGVDGSSRVAWLCTEHYREHLGLLP